MNKSGKNIPLVSVCCITYNHESYIERALKGMLSQKTTFPIEILIHDDASTDNTANIVKKYAAGNPTMIFPVFQKKNQYSQGVPIDIHFNIPRSRGKYLALCEGDDYWSDPSKLQAQIDFLERNPSLAMCTHEAIYEKDVGDTQDTLRSRVGILKRYYDLFGLTEALRVLIIALTTSRSLVSWDLTHRSARRSKNESSYNLIDFQDGATHMSYCSMVLRKNILKGFCEAFYITPRGSHQLFQLVGALTGGIGHLHKVLAVKTNQASSVTQDKVRQAENRRLSSSADTNEKIKRYRYLRNKCSDSDRRIFDSMIDNELKRIHFSAQR